MSNFIILFQGREGTSPLVRLLDQFEGVSVIRHANQDGWEPFDGHNCGRMPTERLVECLDAIYSPEHVPMERINQLYTQTASVPLHEFDQSTSIGFKTRFRPPNRPFMARLMAKTKLGRKVFRTPLARIGERAAARYREQVVPVLRKHDVRVLLAVRQDIFRWALSAYHGDGTGKQGHLQFKLAQNKISREDIPKVRVDKNRFRSILAWGRSMVEAKVDLAAELRAAGLRVTPLYYEDFCADKHAFFNRLFSAIDIPVTDEQIAAVLEAGAHFEKVHSTDISTFVINHEEIQETFGHESVDFDALCQSRLGTDLSPTNQPA